MNRPEGPLPGLADTALLRDPPATVRGARTRAALITAAREIFERDGYFAAKLTDIPKSAGCSTGTFYTYFSSKEEVFHALLASVQDDMLHPSGADTPPPELSPLELVTWGVRTYLDSYRRNARLMLLLEQVTMTELPVREARLQRNEAFVARNARFIERLQEAGHADASIDARQASRALSAMVSRIGYLTFCLGEGPDDIDELTMTLSQLWANALRFTPDMDRMRGSRKRGA